MGCPNSEDNNPDATTPQVDDTKDMEPLMAIKKVRGSRRVWLTMLSCSRRLKLHVYPHAFLARLYPLSHFCPVLGVQLLVIMGTGFMLL